MLRFDIKLVKSQNGIVEVAKELGHEAKGNAMRCPMAHSHPDGDSGLTLRFNERSNTFSCSQCSLHGDVIDLVKVSRGIGTSAAIRFLAERAKIKPVATGTSSSMDSPTPEARATHARAAEIYRFFLDKCDAPNQKAMQWLADHAITERTVLQQGLRFVANPGRLKAELKTQYPNDQLKEAGLINDRGNLVFSVHRLIIPLWDNALPVGLVGRVLDGRYRPQELCLARPVPCPFNIDTLESKPKRVYLCQDLLDTLTLIEHKKPAIGLQGGICKNSWLPLLEGVETVIAFHADIAGHTASARLTQKLREAGIKAQIARLPDNFTVNDLFMTLRQFVS